MSTQQPPKLPSRLSASPCLALSLVLALPSLYCSCGRGCATSAPKPPPCILSISVVTDALLWHAFGSGQAADEFFWHALGQGRQHSCLEPVDTELPGAVCLSLATALARPSAVPLSSRCTALSEIHSPVTACMAGKKPVLQGVWNELSCREQGRDALVSLRRGGLI